MLRLVLAGFGDVDGLVRRSLSVTERNATALRGYWVYFLTNFVEPLFYLLAIGIGLGTRIGDIAVPGGGTVPYAEFVAPAMLAATAAYGALSEMTFSFFSKLKYMNLYEGVTATPVRPVEIALGELVWAVLRGAAYSAAFLAVVVALGMMSVGGALAALVATLLIGAAFGSLGMLLSAAIVRGWPDLRLVGLAQFALFLFSGTFVPIAAYPLALQWVVRATPLYHAVELVRGLATGTAGWAAVVSALYLVAMTVLGVAIASRRVNGRLYG